MGNRFETRITRPGGFGPSCVPERRLELAAMGPLYQDWRSAAELL